MDKMRSLTERLEIIRENQKEILKLKNMMNQMKNATERINSRLYQAKERICEVKEGTFGIIYSENKRKRMKRVNKSYMSHGILLRETIMLWVPEGEERKKGAEKLFQVIMAENFSNIQGQEINQSNQNFNPKQSFSIYIIIKSSKSKDKENFQISKWENKKPSHTRKPSYATSVFLSRNLASQERVEWHIQSPEIKKKKIAGQEYIIQQSCPIEMKVRYRLCQPNKSWGSSSP